MRACLLVLVVSVLAGCGNACQTFCSTLADYAEECGTTFSDADIASCENDFADATSDQLQTCRQFGDATVLRREWSCDDVELYRGSGSDTDL